MKTRFLDRRDAGRQLAEALGAYRGQADVLVLALPRGGVPVAFEVAKALNAPLDLMLVRKLGSPRDPELAFGAVAMGDVVVFNDDVMRLLRLPTATVDEILSREKEVLARRNDLYREGRSAPDVRDRTVILVDDGIATGPDMSAAVRAVRSQKPAKIVVAAPVSAVEALERLKTEAEDVVAVLAPPDFLGVGQFYDDFSPTEDAEVIELVKSFSSNVASP